MHTRLKICGMKRDEDIHIANSLPLSYIGFIFAPSKRQINLEQAIHLKKLLKPTIHAVGVFVDAPLETVVHTVKSGAIDLVQLHGSETNQYLCSLKEQVPVPVIKTIQMGKEKAFLSFCPDADYYLLDSGAGSGKTFDWNQTLSLNNPLFLAGGIGIENIEEAISRFHPYAVDVSSSVEVDGIKNEQKMRELSKKITTLNGENNE